MAQVKSLPRPTRLRPRLTYQQFLGSEGENDHVESVDGEVIEMPPISDAHKVLVSSEASSRGACGSESNGFGAARRTLR